MLVFGHFRAGGSGTFVISYSNVQILCIQSTCMVLVVIDSNNDDDDTSNNDNDNSNNNNHSEKPYLSAAAPRLTQWGGGN